MDYIDLLNKLELIGYGIRVKTYFRLLYPIYTSDNEYYIIHLAIFGVN